MTKYSISKTFHFSAGHRILGGGKCESPHGHNYAVTIFCSSNALDNRGMVVDFYELKPIGEWIDRHFDHAFLYDSRDKQMAWHFERAPEWKRLALINTPPSAEGIAQHILENCELKWPQLKVVGVRVRETDNCCGEVWR